MTTQNNDVNLLLPLWLLASTGYNCAFGQGCHVTKLSANPTGNPVNFGYGLDVDGSRLVFGAPSRFVSAGSTESLLVSSTPPNEHVP